MILRCDEPGHIASLMRIEDDVDKFFSCTRDEFLQWLMAIHTSPKLAVFAHVKDNKPNAYIVAVNTVNLPISDAVNILYIFTPTQSIGGRLLDATFKWAKSVGAARVNARVSDAFDLSKRLPKSQTKRIERTGIHIEIKL